MFENKSEKESKKEIENFKCESKWHIKNRGCQNVGLCNVISDYHEWAEILHAVKPLDSIV